MTKINKKKKEMWKAFPGRQFRKFYAHILIYIFFNFHLLK